DLFGHAREPLSHHQRADLPRGRSDREGPEAGADQAEGGGASIQELSGGDHVLTRVATPGCTRATRLARGECTPRFRGPPPSPAPARSRASTAPPPAAGPACTRLPRAPSVPACASPPRIPPR